MILIVSDNFPFNLKFTSQNFRIMAPIYFFEVNQFILNLISASELVILIVTKMIPKKLQVR